MDERELDRAIDTAAASMMAREPGRALSYNVMVRVREDVTPSPRRLVWTTAAASVLVCAAIAIALLYRAPHQIPSLPAARPLAVAQPPAVEPPIVLANDMRPAPARRIDSGPIVRRVARAVAVPVDASPIQPLAAEPIVVPAIDVPRIEPDAPAAIEALNIEQLTIEPLAASND